MKKLGYLLITIGFLAGSYFATERPEGVSTAAYLAAFLVGVVGVVLARRAMHAESRAEGKIATNLGAIASSLESVVAKAKALDDGKASIDVYELRHVIDRDFPDDLDAFVQARESMAHRFGLQAYADVMNPFAAGERALNRVWSTSTDGYIDEAHKHVTKAREQFHEALMMFRRHHS